jgi:redox-sensitive bicupin YhaK (pirin superfamily)
LPERRGLLPSYGHKTYGVEEKRGRLRLVGSHDGRDGSVTMHRDVGLCATMLSQNAAVGQEVRARRCAWLQVARGTVSLNGERSKPATASPTPG